MYFGASVNEEGKREEVYYALVMNEEPKRNILNI